MKGPHSKCGRSGNRRESSNLSISGIGREGNACREHFSFPAFLNGQLIIVKYGEENPKFPLITDGHLQKNILDIIGKDKEWLQEELKKQGYHGVGEVYLGEYNKGELKLFPYKS